MPASGFETESVAGLPVQVAISVNEGTGVAGGVVTITGTAVRVTEVQLEEFTAST